MGFNGERIHFGASGCRCVGGNKNREKIDYPAEMAVHDAIAFARMIIEKSTGLAWSLVCNVCSGVRNIVRALVFSIAGLAYVASKLIEMCLLLARILH